jgi:predicted NBD/HSP70 family sugar kinase
MRKIDLTNFQLATSETARHINRRIALNIIRRHQPMSRADLARRSGLQRSTVSAIIDQLIGEGWVTEGASAVSARGRRPRFLHLNVERAGIIAVDLRPGTTKVGLAGLDARFLLQADWPTPQRPEDFARRLAQTVAAFRDAYPDMHCEGVGVSIPGRVDESGILLFAPNLGWGRVNLRRLLESKLDLPVAFENAANACALAELWFGRQPDDVRNLVAVTVSEGIGVGLILNGQLFHGAGGLAGEFGHVTLDETGPKCRCGKRGCWERFASNSAALACYRGETGGRRRARAPRIGPQAYEDLLRLADEGDARAIETIERQAYWLGVGIAPIVTGLTPQVLVLVGPITAAWNRVGPIIEDTVRRRSMPLVTTRIVPTNPATEPRLRGAVTLIVQKHFVVPHVA